MKIKCSWWQQTLASSPNIITPCVVYMHGNSSARIECLPQLSLVLQLGVTMFAFDFTGSGKSDGDYVSLGYYEKDDLMVIFIILIF